MQKKNIRIIKRKCRRNREDEKTQIIEGNAKKKKRARIKEAKKKENNLRKKNVGRKMNK